MIAITLAAGYGSRMGQLTKEIPKAMLSFQGETLFARQARLFKKYNLQHYVISGHGHSTIPIDPAHKIINPHYDHTNMVYSLFCARALLAECSNKQDIIISYGDILYQQTILKKLLQSNEGDIQVCADQNWFAYWSMRMSDPLSDVENFSIAPTGFLKNIGGKPANLSEVQGQYMGLFKISKNFIGKFIESYDALSHAQIDHQKLSMTDFLQLLISAGCQIFPLLFNGGWLELDTAQEYEMYQCLDAQKTLNQFYDHVL